jgi:hypothetical protein
MVLSGIAGQFRIYIQIASYFDNVVDYDEAADNEALAHLQSVYTGINIYGVSAKYCDIPHVDVVKNS